MNLRLTLKVQGGLLLFLGGMLLTPIPFSLYFRDGALLSFLAASAAALLAGWMLFRWLDAGGDITYREGFAIVTLGWVFFAVFGALPYLFSGTIFNPIDALFESMSGFTTTGSTVITNLGDVAESVLFWRSMTQWLGGMGIIVLSLAILPFLGVGGMQLFEAEVPGPTADRLSPRIQDTAKVLWGVYFLITFAELCLLWAGPDMNFFEAICHCFTTMATGGFSTEDASIAAFSSSYTHVVITFFMFLAGVNFSLHYRALGGNFRGYWRSEEFRFFGSLLLGATLLTFVLNLGLSGSLLTKLRDAAFQTVSLATTTGYATADYEVWPVMAQYVLITLMFIGGCAGSTGGGMKVVRHLLVLKHAFLQVSRLIHPREVRLLKLDHQPVSPEVIQGVLGFAALYLGLFLFASLLMAGFGVDLVTAGASVIACLSNIGPGLGEVGPTDNFAHIPAAGKISLTACMLVGRLEVFTVLVLFFPSFWRK